MSLKLVSIFQSSLCRKLQQICHNHNKSLFLCRNISLTTLTSQNQHNKEKTNKPYDLKKNKSSPKITLFGPNNAVSITSLEDALKLSKRRDLKLVKIQEDDSKTQRPVYKLLTAADLLAEETSGTNSNYQNVEDTKGSEHKKVEKSLTIGARIADHDLSSRIKNIVKWLQKNHEVRILIQGNSGDNEGMEKVFEKIELAVNNSDVQAKIVQRRIKGGNMKFNILRNKSNPSPL